MLPANVSSSFPLILGILNNLSFFSVFKIRDTLCVDTISACLLNLKNECYIDLICLQVSLWKLSISSNF